MTIGKFKSTPLIRSIYSNNLEIIKALLKAGARHDLGNHSPILATIGEKKGADIIQLLGNYGANMNIVNPGQTDFYDLYSYRNLSPLEYAIMLYYLNDEIKSATLRCIDALIRTGASINSVSSKNKFLPLNFAIYEFLNTANNESEDCIELLKLLIKSGAKVNLQDADGNTALHQVLGYYFHLETNYERERLKCTRFLLDIGANPNIKNKEGKTPLSLAQSRYRDEIIALLKQHGAIDSRNE